MSKRINEHLFFVISVNHVTSNLELRNKFAFTSKQIEELYKTNSPQSSPKFVLISTCNRTEFYTNSADVEWFVDLFFYHSGLDKKEYFKHIEILENEAAVKHLYRVAAGIESKILGDYEIVGQLKKAFALAKMYDNLDGYVEKIFNTCLAASKEIKTQTRITNGTTSVSFFTIHLLKQFLTLSENKYQVTLLGLGKIGINTLKNLQTHLPEMNIIVINRNEEKAIAVSRKYNIKHLAIDMQQSALQESDILIVASSASTPIIHHKDIINTKIKYVFDLSIPSNVAPEVKDLKGVKVINIDELSSLVDETLKQREAEIPNALEIINKNYKQFVEWQTRRLSFSQKTA